MTLWLSNQVDESHQAKKFKPILSLGSSGSLPFLSVALRDPSLGDDLVRDDVEADQFQTEIKGLLHDMKKTKGPALKEKLRSVYRKHLALNYFYEDIMLGKVRSFEYDKKAASLLRQGRQSLVITAGKFATLRVPKRAKAVAKYHELTTRYLMGEKRGISKGLRSIQKNLPQYLKNRSTLLLSTRYNSFSKKRLRSLKRVSNKLPKSGRIVANLLLAKHYVASKNRQYRTYLYRGSKLAGSYPTRLKDQYLSYATYLWQKSGRNINWSRPPFAMKRYKATSGGLAILERSALRYHQKNMPRKAAGLYGQLSRHYQGTPTMVRLDQRLIDIHLHGFKRSKNIRGYEAALLRGIHKYSDQDILGVKHQQLAKSTSQSIKGKHKALVFSLLSKADQTRTSSSFTKEAIRVAMQFIQITPDQTDKTKARELVARIYAKNGKHSLAVKNYDILLQSKDKSKEVKYLGLALQSQSKLAKWPSKPSFQRRPSTGFASQRTKLISYYAKLQSLSKTPQWPLISQIGLLKINLGQSADAFKLWTVSLEKNSQGPYPREASELMLHVYHKAQQWDELQKIADICQKKGITPTRHHKKPLRFYLGEALFEGGKKHFQAGNYKKSWQKLARFNKEFRHDKRRDESLFITAHAYHKDKQHNLAVTSLVAHAKEYQRSPNRAKVLKFGGRLSTTMAQEDHTIFFYQTLLNERKEDPDRQNIRKDLIALYMGRGLYGNAARLHKDEVEDQSVSKTSKVKSAIAYMDIEEKYGSTRDASWGAKASTTLSKKDSTLAKTLAFEARQASSKKNGYNLLVSLNMKASNLDTNQDDVREHVAEIRYLLASSMGLDQKEDVFNIGIADHTKALQKRYAKFWDAKRHYDNICDLGDNTYCAPAMQKVSHMTDSLIQTIEDINIQENLDAKSVNEFHNLKHKILTSLTKIGIKADQRAYRLASEGQTTPQFASSIIWEHTGDWDFEPQDEQVGNTFIQWSVEEGR